MILINEHEQMNIYIKAQVIKNRDFDVFRVLLYAFILFSTCRLILSFNKTIPM